MNFEQEGGVTIPKQLDISDLKASQGLGKVLTRLNYIFRDADQKYRRGDASVAGKMTISGEKHYSEVKRFIDRNQLFADPNDSLRTLINRLVSSSDAFVFDKKTNRNSSKTLTKLMKKHSIKNSIFKLNGNLKQLHLKNSRVVTHDFGENQHEYEVPGNTPSEKTNHSDKVPSLLQDFFSSKDKHPILLLNRTMPSDEELLNLFSMPRVGVNKNIIPGFMMINGQLSFVSEFLSFNLIPVETRIKRKNVTLCAIGMSLNTLGVSGHLKTVYDKGVEMMEKRIRGSVSMLTNVENTKKPTPVRRSSTRRSSTKRSASVSERQPKYLTRKFSKVVEDGQTVSPEAVQLQFSKSPKKMKSSSNNSNKLHHANINHAAKPKHYSKKFGKVVKDGQTVSPEAVQLEFSKSPGQYKVRSNSNNSEGIHASLESVTGKRRKSKKGKKSRKN